MSDEKSDSFFRKLSLSMPTFSTVYKHVAEISHLKKNPNRDKRLSVHQQYPDEYYKSVHLPRKTFENVKLIAEIEGQTLKSTVDKLVEDGLAVYLVNLIERNPGKIRQLNLEQRKAIENLIKEMSSQQSDR